MKEHFFDFIDFILFAAVILFNYFFFNMWHILYGKWYRWTPTWKWLHDIRELKRLSVNAPTDEMRKQCEFVLNGIYFSIGLLGFGILFGFFIS